MAHVDMNETATSTAALVKPEGSAVLIRVEDITRNTGMIMRAVETNTTRLTTRAISRFVCFRVRTTVICREGICVWKQCLLDSLCACYAYSLSQ